MLRVVFKNLRKSKFAEDIVATRVNAVLEKFPEYKPSSATAILEMENSPLQAGPDIYNVKLILTDKSRSPIVLRMKSGHLYQAAAMLADRLLEVMHRAVEKRRDVRRFRRRRDKYAHTHFQPQMESYSNVS